MLRSPLRAPRARLTLLWLNAAFIWVGAAAALVALRPAGAMAAAAGSDPLVGITDALWLAACIADAWLLLGLGVGAGAVLLSLRDHTPSNSLLRLVQRPGFWPVRQLVNVTVRVSLAATTVVAVSAPVAASASAGGGFVIPDRPVAVPSAPAAHPGPALSASPRLHSPRLGAPPVVVPAPATSAPIGGQSSAPAVGSADGVVVPAAPDLTSPALLPDQPVDSPVALPAGQSSGTLPVDAPSGALPLDPSAGALAGDASQGVVPTQPTAPTTTGDHVVRPGDCLWNIAADELGPQATPRAVDARWRQWYAANLRAIGPSPDLLLPGQSLVRPPLT